MMEDHQQQYYEHDEQHDGQVTSQDLAYTQHMHQHVPHHPHHELHQMHQVHIPHHLHHLHQSMGHPHQGIPHPQMHHGHSDHMHHMQHQHLQHQMTPHHAEPQHQYAMQHHQLTQHHQHHQLSTQAQTQVQGHEQHAEQHIQYEVTQDVPQTVEPDTSCVKKKKKRKKKRDPAAPKHPMSGYIIFSSAFREQVKEETGATSVTEIAKQLGMRWKEMDEEARRPYQEKAEADKQRYAREMSTYVPRPNWEKELKKAKKAKKDPNAPKKPMSAFMLYYNQIRETIRAENPDAKMGQLSKIAGERWRGMDDEQKVPFQETQAKLKEEYTVAVKNYRGF